MRAARLQSNDGPAEQQQSARGDPASADAHGDPRPLRLQLDDKSSEEDDQHEHGASHAKKRALSHENVGMVLTREMAVECDQLVIRVPIATPDSIPVVRTLTCKHAC